MVSSAKMILDNCFGRGPACGVFAEELFLIGKPEANRQHAKLCDIGRELRDRTV